MITKGSGLPKRPSIERSQQRLLIVATGNVTNTALLSLFETQLDAIATALEEADFVELSPDFLVVHQRREDGHPR